jgi:hypothetical protein
LIVAFCLMSRKLAGTSLILRVVGFTADFVSTKLQVTCGTGLNVFVAMIVLWFVTLY